MTNYTFVTINTFLLYFLLELNKIWYSENYFWMQCAITFPHLFGFTVGFGGNC